MPRKPAPVQGVFQRADSQGFWYARYRVDGKLVKKSFGHDRRAAVAFIEKLRVVRRSGDGHVPRTAKEQPKTADELRRYRSAKGVLLSELCDDLLRHIESKPDQYKDQRNPPYRIGMISEKFGHRLAESIRPYEIEDWLDSLRVAPATANRYKNVLSSVYRYGRQRDKVHSNPAREVAQRRVNNGVIRYMTADEEKRIRQALQEQMESCGPNNKRRRLRIEHHLHEMSIAIHTGMRKSEQYTLLWSQVDFEERHVTLNFTKPGEGRRIPMNETVYQAFRSLREMNLSRKDRTALIPNPAPSDAVFGIGDNKRWWENTLRRANVANLRWHDLRHTFCSRLAQAGISLKIIQELAGHKSISMTARYAHMDMRNLISSVKVLD